MDSAELCSRARACGLDSVVLYRHVGWTVGDNRGSTEQKQMAPTSVAESSLGRAKVEQGQSKGREGQNGLSW